MKCRAVWLVTVSLLFSFQIFSSDSINISATTKLLATEKIGINLGVLGKEVSVLDSGQVLANAPLNISLPSSVAIPAAVVFDIGAKSALAAPGVSFAMSGGPESENGGSGSRKSSAKNSNKKKKEKEIKEFEIKGNDAHHMFRNKKGHMPEDTPRNRKLLHDLVSNEDYFLGECSRGTRWYGRPLSDGKQLWAGVRNNNIIKYGGLNESVIEFNPISGLCCPTRPKFKSKV